MNARQMIKHCTNQQTLQGKENVTVTFVIKGKWPARGNQKRLLGRYGGPMGECVCECEDGVLCAFDAREVVRFLTPIVDETNTTKED